MNTFQAGKTYTTRSIGDQDCIISITVASRTAKTIKTSDGKTLRVAVYDGSEFVKPWGSYSMAPILRAPSVYKPAPMPELLQDPNYRGSVHHY